MEGKKHQQSGAGGYIPKIKLSEQQQLDFIKDVERDKVTTKDIFRHMMAHNRLGEIEIDKIKQKLDID